MREMLRVCAIVSGLTAAVVHGGCADVQDMEQPSSSPDAVGRTDEALGGACNGSYMLAKRQYTWSIERGSDGWYIPRFSWIIDAPLQTVVEENSKRGAIPGDVTLTSTPDGKTQVVLPRMTNAYVEDILETTVASWASVANVQFRRVLGPADLTFKFPEFNAGAPWAEGQFIANKNAANEITGGSIVVGMTVEKQDDYWPFWKNGDRIAQYLHSGYENGFLKLELHEFGHFLGLDHAFCDPDYGRDSYGNERECPSGACLYPASEQDYSVMDYNQPSPTLLSEQDIALVQAKYGAPAHVPMIELFVSSMNEHFYTRSWQEANHVLQSGYASGVRFKNLTGALLPDPSAGRTPLHRFFEPFYNGHTYIRSASPSRPGAIYEGVMGYTKDSSARNFAPMGTFHLRGSSDERFFTSDNEPEGYVYTGVNYGYVIPRRNVGRF